MYMLATLKKDTDSCIRVTNEYAKRNICVDSNKQTINPGSETYRAVKQVVLLEDMLEMPGKWGNDIFDSAMKRFGALHFE